MLHLIRIVGIMVIIVSMTCLTRHDSVAADQQDGNVSEVLTIDGAGTEGLSSAISCDQDRLWLISTRRLPYSACAADLESPCLDVRRIDCGHVAESDLDQFQHHRDPTRPLVVYVHGNRMPACDLMPRAMLVYRNARSCRSPQGVDWLIWSWPSDKQGAAVGDARIKRERTDAQALYLAWTLKPFVDQSTPIVMIGFSFGARVIAGSLHALAGGAIAGRCLPDTPMVGANVSVGFIAPALDACSMSSRGLYNQSTKNIGQMTLLYNDRDIVLKRFWRLTRVRRAEALGYSGPKSFACRVDGTPLPVRSKDCSTTIGLSHSEVGYYQSSCRAGTEMARLIHQMGPPSIASK